LPEPNSFEASKNPKFEYRNPKQIRNSNVQKQQTKKRHLNLEPLDLFPNFGFRASNLEFALSIENINAVLRTT